MKISELFEGRHPHDQYYRAKPKSQFKTKPRPKKTLWYNNEQFDNWSTDIRTRFSDAAAYYDEENEEVVACSGDMKNSYGKWSKNKDDGFNGVSFYKPRPLDTVTRGRKRLRLAKEGFSMKLKELINENNEEIWSTIFSHIDSNVAEFGFDYTKIQDAMNEMADTYYRDMGFSTPEEAEEIISQKWRNQTENGRELQKKFSVKVGDV